MPGDVFATVEVPFCRDMSVDEVKQLLDDIETQARAEVARPLSQGVWFDQLHDGQLRYEVQSRAEFRNLTVIPSMEQQFFDPRVRYRKVIVINGSTLTRKNPLRHLSGEQRGAIADVVVQFAAKLRLTAAHRNEHLEGTEMFVPTHWAKPD